MGTLLSPTEIEAVLAKAEKDGGVIPLDKLQDLRHTFSVDERVIRGLSQYIGVQAARYDVLAEAALGIKRATLKSHGTPEPVPPFGHGEIASILVRALAPRE